MNPENPETIFIWNPDQYHSGRRNYQQSAGFHHTDMVELCLVLSTHLVRVCLSLTTSCELDQPRGILHNRSTLILEAASTERQ